MRNQEYVRLKPTLILCLTLALFGIVVESAHAEGAKVTQEVNDRIGVVDQFVQLESSVEKAFLLIESGLGELKQYPADVYMQPDKANAAKRLGGGEALVAAKISLDEIPKKNTDVHYTFFLIQRSGEFYGTPVRTTSYEKIVATPITLDGQYNQVASLRDENNKLIPVIDNSKTEIAKLRKQASSIAGVEEIVDLKMELSGLQGFGAEFEAEQERLRELIELGRSQTDPKDVQTLRAELNRHLQEAAQATAMADRLQSRKQNAALSSLKQQLALIKETGSYNVEELARKVLELRRRRRELEARLNIGSRPDNEQF